MSGHGWVTPNPDGSKARCGGPAICSVCALENGTPLPRRQPDKPQAAVEVRIALRAHALCAAAEPHRSKFQTCPCGPHQIEARRMVEAGALVAPGKP